MAIDDIVTKAPVNKTAALVVGKGVHYEPNKKVTTADSGTPLPIDKRKKCDCVGLRRGRLTVVGYSTVNGRLVVRCDCGTYTLRKAKAMKNEANEQDRCEHCRHLAFLKRAEHYRRTGKDADIRDF